MCDNINTLDLEIDKNKVYFIMYDNNYIKQKALEFNSEKFIWDRKNWENSLFSDLSDEKWKRVIDEIQNNDYLAIINANDVVITKLSEYINKNDLKEVIEANCLYKIYKKDKKLLLKKIFTY